MGCMRDAICSRHAILIDPKGIVRFEGHPGYLNYEDLASLLDKYGQ